MISFFVSINLYLVFSSSLLPHDDSHYTEFLKRETERIKRDTRERVNNDLSDDGGWG